MSEYPIGLNGEMIHCLADDEYSRFCRSKLEKEVRKYEEKTAQEVENGLLDSSRNTNIISSLILYNI
jgi:hypothetical protein